MCAVGSLILPGLMLPTVRDLAPGRAAIAPFRSRAVELLTWPIEVPAFVRTTERAVQGISFYGRGYAFRGLADLSPWLAMLTDSKRMALPQSHFMADASNTPGDC